MHPQIEYTDGLAWCPLPDWAAFYWQLGARMARWASPTHRAVCLLSVPTREFVAPLVAAGYLAHRSMMAQLADAAAYPPGTTILFEMASGRWSLGRIAERVHHVLLGPSFKVEVARNSRFIVSAESAVRFTRSREDFDPDRRARPKAPRLAIKPTDFCHALLSGGASVYLRSERPRCVLLGPLAVLETECRIAGWRVPDALEMRGALADLLRVHEFLDPHDPWHTRVLSSRLPLVDDSAPDLVVLDGASALKRGSGHYTGSDQVFVLDRSATTIDEALDASRQEQASRDPSVADDQPLSPPVGVAYTVFARRRVG